MNWNEKRSEKGVKGFKKVPLEKQKNECLRIMLTKQQKSILVGYCKEYEISLSDFVRLAIYQKLKANNVAGLDGKPIIDENQLSLFDN